MPDGWAAYERDDTVFMKRFEYSPDAKYPDLGCSVEVFTNSEMMELETLGPLVSLAPANQVEHVEHWELGCALSPDSESVSSLVGRQISDQLRP